MSDEPNKEPETPKETPPDPYASVAESERDAVKELNEYLGSLSVVERARVVDIAQRAHNKGMLAQIYGQTAEPPATLPPLKVEPEPDDMDDTTALKAQVAALAKKIEAQDKKERDKAQFEDFDRTVKTALVEAGVDKEDIEQRFEEFCGHYLKHKPMNIAESVKRFNKKQEEREVDRQKRRAERKIADQKMKGESGGGSVPAKKAEELGRDDLSSGKTAARVKELLKQLS